MLVPSTYSTFRQVRFKMLLKYHLAQNFFFGIEEQFGSLTNISSRLVTHPRQFWLSLQRTCLFSSLSGWTLIDIFLAASVTLRDVWATYTTARDYLQSTYSSAEQSGIRPRTTNNLETCPWPQFLNPMSLHRQSCLMNPLKFAFQIYLDVIHDPRYK